MATDAALWQPNHYWTRNGVLYVNPGSAGPRRFTLPVSVGFLEIDGAKVSAHIELLSA